MPGMKQPQRVILLAVIVIVASVIVFLASEHPGHIWIQAGVVFLVPFTIYLGVWAKQRGRFSLAFALLLTGNALLSCAVLLPLSMVNRSWLLDAAASLYALSFLARIVRLGRFMARKA
jgi:hypothetical protein